MKRGIYQSYYKASQRSEGKPIILPPSEYAMVMSELNSYISAEDRELEVIAKPIGDYIYVVENHGYDDYSIIGKYPIDDEDELNWEES